jgi:O-antigen/teichoic acid export membrane protein
VTGAAVALALIPISPEYRRAVLRPRLPRRLPAGFWRFTIPAALAGVVGGLVMSRSEIFFMTWLATPAAVGAFALAYGLASHVFAPAQAFIGPLVPAISGLREIDSEAIAPAFLRTLRAGSTFVGLIIASAVTPLALLVPLLYGADFTSAAPLVLALGISSGLLIVASPVSAFVTARLSAGELLRANLVALAVDASLAITLIPVLGVWGAVIANIGGAGTRLTLLMRQEIRLLGIRWRTVANQALPATMGAGVSVVAWFAAQPLGAGVVPALVAGVVGLGGALGLLTLTRSGLTAADAHSISRPFPGPAGRLAVRALPLVSRRRDDE